MHALVYVAKIYAFRWLQLIALEVGYLCRNSSLKTNGSRQYLGVLACQLTLGKIIISPNRRNCDYWGAAKRGKGDDSHWHKFFYIGLIKVLPPLISTFWPSFVSKGDNLRPWRVLIFILYRNGDDLAIDVTATRGGISSSNQQDVGQIRK